MAEGPIRLASCLVVSDSTEQAEALMVQVFPITSTNHLRIMNLEAKSRTPVMTTGRRSRWGTAHSCALGRTVSPATRRAAIYVDKILKDAKALGLEIPQSVLIRADEVIP